MSYGWNNCRCVVRVLHFISFGRNPKNYSIKKIKQSKPIQSNSHTPQLSKFDNSISFHIQQQMACSYIMPASGEGNDRKSQCQHTSASLCLPLRFVILITRTSLIRTAICSDTPEIAIILTIEIVSSITFSVPCVSSAAEGTSLENLYQYQSCLVGTQV
jgi:hypothetical protein